MTERLAVVLYGDVIAYLERGSAQDRPTLTYTPSYVAGGVVPLSTRLPIASAPYPAERVSPYLRGLLPENEQARQRWADRLEVDPEDYFGMLAEMGWDCPGAVQLCREADVERLIDEAGSYEPISDDQIAGRLEQLVAEPASWTMPDEHWSLGGQQEKFALARIDGVWNQVVGSGATTHIFKPGIKVLMYQALVEHVTMRAAASLGVSMARTELLPFGDQWAIVVERFDRESRHRSIVRLHQEDFCQAVGRQPERKYESRGGPSLPDMVNLVKRQMTDPTDDARALADFAAINLVAGAPDGHAKNISILLAPSGERWVAPLYDLATGLSYARDDVERRVAVSIGGERIFSRIRGKQWARAAGQLGLPEEQVKRRVRNLAEQYPAAFAGALAELGGIPGADEVADRTLQPLRTHCERLLLQLDE